MAQWPSIHEASPKDGTRPSGAASPAEGAPVSSAEDAGSLVRQVLHELAPRADPDTMGPDEALQEALDLDSLDFLQFVVGLHQRTGVDIPERDYPQLSTLEGCVDYLHRHRAGPATDPSEGADTWTSN